MDEIVRLQNVESVCRLCLSTDKPKSSIFNVDDSSVPLVVKIQACLSIQISSNDRLPALICAHCIRNVNKWHAYKESCLRSQNKLQQWLANQTLPEQLLVTVKQEPMDLECDEDNDTVVIESDDSTKQNANDSASYVNDVQMLSHNEHRPDVSIDDQVQEKEIEDSPAPTSPPTLVKESERNPLLNKQFCMVHVKSEPLVSDGSNCNLEIASICNSELLLNPVAVGVGQEDRVMEADSTQKSNSATSPSKKKVKRGPHTHFRGIRVFKQKCSYCQIHLHSKYSYMKHMERFHSPKGNVTKENVKLKAISSVKQKSSTESVRPSQNMKTPRSSISFHDEEVSRGESPELNDDDDDEEMIEDVEEEIDSMEQDAPLSQVQQDIISQLKTFSCYSCQQVFHDRRSTLNHIRQHMPDLRPYTCIACLTEFADRSIYKSHCGSSFECAMKIALVEPKLGCEKYFTCNMCLRPMVNRKELLSHLSKHSDKQYAKLISPMRSPPKLKPMIPLPTTKSEIITKTSDILNILGPYGNGNPAFNHVCDLCGMIYRYKPNMFKHKELCRRLPPEVRTSYKCIHCGMTFLVFKKFHTHLTVEHKKKELTCSSCCAKFKSPSDYLTHHEKHKKTTGNNEVGNTFSSDNQSPLKNWKTFDDEVLANKSRINCQKFSCTLCGQEFPTKSELSEHKNLHLKVKIYSCVICRSMFSNSGALEIHMKDHGIEDPNERNANSSCVEYARTDDTRVITGTNMPLSANSTRQDVKCQTCDKGFSNVANLKRHIRNIHETREYFKCTECIKTYKSKLLLEHHLKTEHKPPKPTLRCPQCPKTFVAQANLNLHVQNIHARASNNKIECDICGKTFLEEQSLKTHRGWHYRVNCRLSLSNLERKRRQTLPQINDATAVKSTKPARARKSFPNAPPPTSSGHLQCQVCDDKFLDVTELRNHLWDVHCARNKPEKSITVEDFQCELCTNVFTDNESLELHLQWHKENPILSNIRKRNYTSQGTKPFYCETCGNHYTSKKTLSRHKKLHRATAVASIKFQSLAKKPLATQFQCNFCRRVFDTNAKLREHKTRYHFNPQNQMSRLTDQPSNFKCEPCAKYYSSVVSLRFHLKKTCPYRNQTQEEPKSKKPRIELKSESEDFAQLSSAMTNSNSKHMSIDSRKPVKCKICQKMFLGMSQLYKHKQEAHNTRSSKLLSKLECIPILEPDGNVSCNVCGKRFASASNLKLHFGIVHKSLKSYFCTICKMAFATAAALKSHSPTHSSMIYSCNLCERHVFTRGAMTKHMLSAHKRLYQSGGNRKDALYTETDLTTYVVKGATGTICPVCKIKYPNIKAMKIHYFKFHE